jgi:hypothetical protein
MQFPIFYKKGVTSAHSFTLYYGKKIHSLKGKSLWLTGVDAPITKKHISKCLKILKKIYLDIHLIILFSFMKFGEKRTVFVASVKIQISVLQHCYLRDHFFVFFTHAIKDVFSSQNFVDEHKLFRCTLRIFV